MDHNTQDMIRRVSNRMIRVAKATVMIWMAIQTAMKDSASKEKRQGNLSYKIDQIFRCIIVVEIVISIVFDGASRYKLEGVGKFIVKHLVL